MARETVETIWAENNPSGVIEPSSGTQENGYGAVKPPFQEHNWVFQKCFDMLQNAERFGIMEWSTDTTYPQYGKSTGSDGGTYKSVQAANNGNDPVADTSRVWWEPEKTDTEYKAVTGVTGVSGTGDLSAVGGLTYDSGYASKSGTVTYTIANLSGTGLVPADIRILHIRSNVRMNAGQNDRDASMFITYPDGSTQPLIVSSMEAGQGNVDNWVDMIVPVPINKGDAAFTITLNVDFSGSGERAKYEIVGATQKAF